MKKAYYPALFIQKRSELYECVIDSGVQSVSSPPAGGELTQVNPDLVIPKFGVNEIPKFGYYLIVEN